MKAKCNNYAGCLLAFRNEVIDIADGAPLICPECGKPLEKGGASSPGNSKMIIAAVVGVVVLIGGFFGFKAMTGGEGKNDVVVTPGTTPAPEMTPEPTPEPVVEEKPVPEEVVQEQVTMDTKSAETAKVRIEVLKRVDLIPDITPQNRDKLINAVNRAKKMGIMLTIPFPAASVDVKPSDAQSIVNALQSPDILRLSNDPTAVFVILGYADPKGDKAKNYQVSRKRAESVAAVMRDMGKVQRVMHTVGMGGSKFIDSKNLEKNRVVEVWAVLP